MLYLVDDLFIKGLQLIQLMQFNLPMSIQGNENKKNIYFKISGILLR